MKLCGLDFETANSSKGSICAAGAALVENGTVLECREYLVKPQEYQFKLCISPVLN